MTTKHRDAAEPWPPATSRPEWVLIYTRGLSIKQIAGLCRADYEKVRLHIRSQERLDPGIHGRRLILHDRPQPAPPPPPEPRRPSWDDARYTELRELTDRTGRLPRQLSEEVNERRLYNWLDWQRERYAESRLTADQKTVWTLLGTGKEQPWGTGRLVGARSTPSCSSSFRRKGACLSADGTTPHRTRPPSTSGSRTNERKHATGNSPLSAA